MNLNNINLIIFSKDRAAQLDLLLRSMYENSNDIFDPIVLYRHTSQIHIKAYQKLFNRMIKARCRKNFIQNKCKRRIEVDFRNDLIEMIEQNESEMVGFLTDDCIFYRKLNLNCENIYNLLYPENNVACVSLRLGTNTNVQTYHVGDLLPPLRYTTNGDLISWNAKDYNPYCNYGYTFSLDGHIFRKKLILDLIKQIDFKNPNQLEASLSQFSHKYQIPSYIIAPNKSCVFACPNNRTQNEYQNACGVQHPYSIDDLAKKYLDNEMITLDCLNPEMINCTHQEIEYCFKQSKNFSEKIITKDILVKEYVENGKSLTKISKEIGCERHAIAKYIKKYNIDKIYDEKIMIGKSFGCLTIIKRDIEDNPCNSTYWICKCICGREISRTTFNLRKWKNPSCGCKGKGYFIENYYNLSNVYINNFIAKSIRENLEFSVSMEYLWDLFIKQNKKCIYSGRDIWLETDYKEKSSSQTASLDRIDSTKGYVVGNVQWVHKHVNILKNIYSEEYFLELIKDIYNYRLSNYVCP
jgi:hypothetical protein